jgi:hypothetical protein
LNVDKTVSGIVTVVRKVTAPTTRDRLVSRALRHPMAPTLNRRQRRRLIRQLGVQEAADAMFEQDDRGATALSRMIARPAFGEAESPKSFALAQILIAELPACLTATEWAAVSAYKLRVIQESVDDVGARVDEVGGDLQLVSKSIDDLRQLLIARDDAPSANPAALIQEILETLGLRDEYLAIEAMEATDPASAAARLSKIIERVTAEGHQAQARPLIKQRAASLTRAGAINAADAWLPIVDDFLKLGLGGGLHEPLKAWQSLLERNDAPPWLRARLEIVNALENWVYGEVRAEALIPLAQAAMAAGDPAAVRWLMHAAESCLVDRSRAPVAAVCNDLIRASQATEDTEAAVRLSLAVADSAADPMIWAQLLEDADRDNARYSPQECALVHARRARNAYWAGDLPLALAHYRVAIERAAAARTWEDAADWSDAVTHLMNLSYTINLTDLTEVSRKQAAFKSAGGGSAIEGARDFHLAALASLIEVKPGGSGARSARGELRKYVRRSLLRAAVTEEITAHALTGRLFMQIADADSAIEHLILGADLDQAVKAASVLKKFHDCYDNMISGPRRQRAIAFRVAAEEADFIPEGEVGRWAEAALTEAKRQEFTISGPDTYVNAYKLIEGLSTRFPPALVDELLTEINHTLPRPEHVGRPVDDQIAKILVNLATDPGDRQYAIADTIASAFELADEVASDIVAYARSISSVLVLAKDRFLALLGTQQERRIRLMNATFALVEMGDHSDQLLAAAEGFVDRELNRPLAYTPNSVARVAWVEEPAIIAKCLSIQRRVDLARHCVQRALDANDIEANRASYAVAFVNLGPELPKAERDSVFDQLYPLAVEPFAVTSPFDAMEQRFRNPLGSFRISGGEGGLRRFALKALAVLATDADRQEQAWRAALKLIVTGERSDSVAVAEVGFRLSERGFAPNLPWTSMVYSADSEMRQLAAAILPFLDEVDFDAVESLAADTVTNVRCELTISLRKLATRNKNDDTTRTNLEAVLDGMRNDVSYRVRAEATTDVSPDGDGS